MEECVSTGIDTTLGNFLDVFGPLLVRKDGTTAAGEAARQKRARNSDAWVLLLDDAPIGARTAVQVVPVMELV
jgi:hypothetical protein